MQPSAKVAASSTTGAAESAASTLVRTEGEGQQAEGEGPHAEGEGPQGERKGAEAEESAGPPSPPPPPSPFLRRSGAEDEFLSARAGLAEAMVAEGCGNDAPPPTSGKTPLLPPLSPPPLPLTRRILI